MKENGFDIIISSDIQYEELGAEIYFNTEFVAIITQEQGIEHSIIAIYPPLNGEKWTFNYVEFIQILKDAQNSLIKMKKES
jgi:phage pi2 protein 07